MTHSAGGSDASPTSMAVTTPITDSPEARSPGLHSVEDIVVLEERHRDDLSLTDHIANTVTAFGGSMIYVGIHVLWFGAWILLNIGIVKAIDPFPFSLLTMIVSLEAIFLAAFVLISQNKSAILADKRAKIDLQINLIAERENTKLIKMIAALQEHLGMADVADDEVATLQEPTNVGKLAEKLDEVNG